MVTPFVMDNRLLKVRRKTILELEPDVLFDANWGVTHSGDGTYVSAWASRRGGITVEQATEANQPRWLANGIGLQPAILFDGGDYMEDTITALTGTVHTVIASVQLTVGTAAPEYMLSFWKSSNAHTLALGFNAGASRTLFTDIGPLYTGANGGTDIGTDAAIVTWTTNAAGDAWVHYVGDTAETMTPTNDGNTGESFSDVTLMDRLTIGASRASTLPVSARIAYIAIWGSLL